MLVVTFDINRLDDRNSIDTEYKNNAHVLIIIPYISLFSGCHGKNYALIL